MVPYRKLRHQVEGCWTAESPAVHCLHYFCFTEENREAPEVKCLEADDPMSEQGCNPCTPEPVCFPHKGVMVLHLDGTLTVCPELPWWFRQ